MLGIQSPSENGFMEPKYLAFWRWLYTPIIIWQGDWILRETNKQANKQTEHILEGMEIYHFNRMCVGNSYQNMYR